MISLFHYGCGDDYCDRHRALAGLKPSVMFAAAMSTAMACSPFAVSSQRPNDTAMAERERSTTLNYMPVTFASDTVGVGEGDPAFRQFPSPEWLHHPHDSTWAVVVRASGAVEVHGDRALAIASVTEVCLSAGKMWEIGHAGYRLYDVGIMFEFPPPPDIISSCWTITQGPPFKELFHECSYPESKYAHTSWPAWRVTWGADRVVNVAGTIPSQALKFWQEVASATPNCAEAR